MGVCLRHLGVLMEVRLAMKGERVGIVHSHRVMINLQLEMMEMVMNGYGASPSNGGEEGSSEAGSNSDGDSGEYEGDASTPILRTVVVRAKSKVEGVHSLIGCLKF